MFCWLVLLAVAVAAEDGGPRSRGVRPLQGKIASFASVADGASVQIAVVAHFSVTVPSEKVLEQGQEISWWVQATEEKELLFEYVRDMEPKVEAPVIQMRMDPTRESLAILRPSEGEEFDETEEVQVHSVVSSSSSAECVQSFYLDGAFLSSIKGCIGVVAIPSARASTRFLSVGQHRIEVRSALLSSAVHDWVNISIVQEEKKRDRLGIPRLFHQVWVGGGRSVPDKFEAYAETWRKLHPDWKFITWTDKNLFELRNADLLWEATSYAEKADVARVEIVEKYGGVYIDTDFECLKPIDALLQNLSLFVAEEDAEKICPSIFGARPNHPFFVDMPQALEMWADQHYDSLPNIKTGPSFWTHYCKENDWLQRFPDSVVFDRSVFYPYGWWELERSNETFSNAFGAHHWAKNWGGGWKSSPQ